jgi:beta-lactamase regulating signal transducer with metallopeptidase domain
MLNNLFELANSLGDRWAVWMVAAILDSVALLATISLIWLAIRRRVAPQLGYLLFLLVPLRLLSPFEVGVPLSVAKWTPSHLLVSWLTRPHSVASDHLSPATENSVVPDGNEVPNGSPLGSRQLTDGASASLETVVGTRSTSATIPAAMLEPAAANLTMRLPAIGLAAWLAIVCLLTVRFIWTQLSFRKHLRAASPIDLSRLPVDFRAECDRAGIRRPVRLVESDRVMAPAAWGIVRPIVILPREITSILTADQLKWVLLHELAHIRRNDLLVIAAQRIVAISPLLCPHCGQHSWRE